MRGSPRAALPRVLVVGCGSIGTRHLRNLRTLGVADLLACDPRPERRREVTTQCGVEAVGALGEAWAWDPTVALITAPTALHASLALEAARRGCHLFVEKPVAAQIDDEVHELLAVVRERHLVTLVGCNLRFHPGLVRVKELLEQGVIGRVVAARAEAGQYLPDWHPGEDYRQGYSASRALGGGVLLDAIHELDYLRGLLGEVTAVACFADKLSHLEIETEDTAAVLLRFANGCIGQVHLDYVQRAYSRTCQLIGDDGTIRWDYAAGQTSWYTAATRQWNSTPNPRGWELNQMYLDELHHLFRCLSGEEQPRVDLVEGVRVLEIALAAKASAEAGHVIRLEPPAARHKLAKAVVA